MNPDGSITRGESSATLNKTCRKGKSVIDAVVDFANLLFAALTAGAMFGIWMGMNPSGLPPGIYVAQQQHVIRRMNVAMPVLGGVTAALSAANALLEDASRPQIAPLGAASACFVLAGLVTRLLNQPINAVVMTWSVESPPAEWTRLRDQWWRWHCARTGLGLVGLCLVILAVLAPTRFG